MDTPTAADRLATSRLELWGVTVDDVATLTALWNDATVRRVHGLGLEPLPAQAVRRWLEDPGRALAWIARETPTGVPVGVVEMGPVGEGVLEMGIALTAQARGRGYGQELIAGLCRWAFASQGATQVVADMRIDNEAARRAFAACGFVADGALGEIVRMRRRPSAKLDSE